MFDVLVSDLVNVSLMKGQCLSQLDMQPIKEHSYGMNFFYVVFITMGSFFILNLFIGVIIENFSKLKQQVITNSTYSSRTCVHVS